METNKKTAKEIRKEIKNILLVISRSASFNVKKDKTPPFNNRHLELVNMGVEKLYSLIKENI